MQQSTQIILVSNQWRPVCCRWLGQIVKYWWYCYHQSWIKVSTARWSHFPRARIQCFPNAFSVSLLEQPICSTIVMMSTTSFLFGFLILVLDLDKWLEILHQLSHSEIKHTSGSWRVNKNDLNWTSTAHFGEMRIISDLMLILS